MDKGERMVLSEKYWGMEIQWWRIIARLTAFFRKGLYIIVLFISNTPPEKIKTIIALGKLFWRLFLFLKLKIWCYSFSDIFQDFPEHIYTWSIKIAYVQNIFCTLPVSLIDAIIFLPLASCYVTLSETINNTKLLNPVTKTSYKPNKVYRCIVLCKIWFWTLSYIMNKYNK